MDNKEAIELLKGVAAYADTEYKKALPLQSPPWNSRRRTGGGRHLRECRRSING